MCWPSCFVVGQWCLLVLGYAVKGDGAQRRLEHGGTAQWGLSGGSIDSTRYFWPSPLNKAVGRKWPTRHISSRNLPLSLTNIFTHSSTQPTTQPLSHRIIFTMLSTTFITAFTLFATVAQVQG